MKTYLIIGASSGIGKALTDRLINQGHQVIGTYHRNKMDSGDKVRYFPLNVMEDFNMSFLPESIDGLVYCPGTIELKPFKRIKSDAFESDFRLQVGGAIRSIQQALPALNNSEEGSIVLFSTVAVQYGFNFHTQIAVSKGAIEGLTRSLAAELAPSIRVNAIAPSLTDTPLAARLLNTEDKRHANAERHPLKRIGEANDMAAAAAYLLSSDASWITGQIIPVDGGMSSIR